MNALIVMVLLGVAFYLLVHGGHGQMGSCHGHGARAGPTARSVWRLPRERARGGFDFGRGLLLLLLLLLPFMVLHYWGGARGSVHPLLFWVFLLLAIVLLPALLGPARRGTGAGPPPPDAPEAAAGTDEKLPVDVATKLASLARDDFDIQVTRSEPGGVFFEGRVRGEPGEAYRRLAHRLADAGWAAHLLEGHRDGEAMLAATPKPPDVAPAPARPAWNIVLFLATLATTTWAGAMHQGVDLLQDPGAFGAGLRYAIPVLLILGAHELGHYFTARRHGIRVSLPYFIPIPFGLGTFGAFIQMRSPIPNRRKLFDVAVAGPLAGLAVAIPALLIGLPQSQLLASGAGRGGTLSSSLLLAGLYSIATGETAGAGDILRFSPLAFAGWLGLLLTALNLLPIGQLDGGHIAYALFGRRRAETVGWAAFFLLLILGIFFWSGWLTWAFIVFFLTGVKHDPAQNEFTPLGTGRQALGAFAFVVLLLIMAPVPHRFMDALGIACPYL